MALPGNNPHNWQVKTTFFSHDVNLFWEMLASLWIIYFAIGCSGLYIHGD